jgi:TPR repeat protein
VLAGTVHTPDMAFAGVLDTGHRETFTKKPIIFESASREDNASEAADEEPSQEEPAMAEELSYLSQARRSAIAAAQTVAEPTDPFQRFATTAMTQIKDVSRGTRLAALGGAALVVVLLGAAIAFKHQSSPESAAVQTAAPISVQVQRAAKTPVLAPQVRLASMASSGNASAELIYGLEYLNGTGVAKDDGKAEQWISLAAGKGNAIAQYWLGTLYANGHGVKADPATALHWYEQAAMQGNRKAMHQLGLSYAEGWGADKNYDEAARWFSRAAALGYVDSAFNLGVLYERGMGMPQSLLDAYKWYSIAVALGDKDSVARLAVLKTQMTPEDVASATQAAKAFASEPMDQSANVTPGLDALPKG